METHGLHPMIATASSDQLAALAQGPSLALVCALLAPALMLAGGLASTLAPRRDPRRQALLASRLGLAACLAALAAAVGLAVSGPGEWRLSALVGFRLDVLSATMLLLVSFLGAVTTRYATAYLAGDARQGVFAKWLCFTLASVLVLVVSGNLLLFALAWIATSLSLHQLLVFHGERPAALLAARKKFLVSRLGDAAVLAALLLAWRCFGTLEFSGIFASAGAATATDSGTACLGGLAWLLVLAAALKSAQFPFHTWLPDTMETPTPVSALMHAGIINAGGFLVVRFSPILVEVPAALGALALVGAFTALFASVVMLTQTSVKRSLAYSTIAQMGFMMLQCGLGAFSLAVLHLVAHSLYKAHAFLSSGGVVELKRSAWTPAGRPSAHPLVLAACLLAAVGATLGIGRLFGIGLSSDPGVVLLGSIFLMALAHLLWSLWADSRGAALALSGVAIALVCSLAYFSLHAASERLLADVLPRFVTDRHPFEYALMAFVALLFLGVLVVQTQLPAWADRPGLRALYVHLSRGLYLGAWSDRATEAIYARFAPQASRTAARG